MTEDHFINSSVREKTLEHIFIGDSCVLDPTGAHSYRVFANPRLLKIEL